VARPAPSGPIQDSASSSIQSPTGWRAKLTVRSALIKVHCRKSSTAEVPLQKSAATTARIACDTGEPRTRGAHARYQIAPGPGTPKLPRAERIEMPVTKGLEEKLAFSSGA